jgi:SulP family sulfate permease
VALVSGLVVGVVLIASSVSVGTLVYGGVAPEQLTLGVRLALLGTAVTGLVVALVGSLPGSVAQVQGATGAILATLAATAAAGVPGDDPAARFATVLTLVATTTLAVGGAFVLIGGLRLGRVVRYLPYPVVGGFVAGTGWLLVLGGGAVASGAGARSSSLAAALPLDRVEHWLPALALGAVLTFAAPRGRYPFVFPALLAGAVAVVYAAMAWSGGTPETWRAEGLLLDAGGGGGGVRLLGPAVFDQVHWPSWALHLPGVATAVLVASMGLSFNSAGLEVELRRRVDLNRELRAAGLANLAAAAFGAPPAYQSLSANVLALRVGDARRTTAIAALVVVVAAIVLGPRLIAWTPTVVVGAMLVSLGLGLLRSWVLDAWRTLSRLEYGIVVLILAVIAGFGLLAGVLAGLVLAVLLFVVTYSRVDAVKHALTGADLRSRMRWERHERRTLAASGADRLVLQLQGYLFFGVAYTLLEGIERRLNERRIDEVIVDFRQVTGADATALASLDAVRSDADARGVRLVFSEVPEDLARAFARRGLVPRAGSSFAFADSLDLALEAAERRALAAAPKVDPLATLSERLEALTDDDLELMDLAVHLERHEVAKGTRLLAGAGERADEVFLVAHGQVSTWLDVPGRSAVRLETLRGGHLVGDVAFYAGTVPRHAWVVADEATTLFRLTREGLARLTAADPGLAARFHRLAARQLAERVTHLTRLVEALQR